MPNDNHTSQPDHNNIGDHSHAANKSNHRRLTRLIEELLECIGENTSRPGLAKTPERVAQNLNTLFAGYNRDPSAVLTNSSNLLSANTPATSLAVSTPITLGPIELLSYCEHDMLPMVGNVWLSYIPKAKIAGFSKFREVIQILGQRLQIQERLTQEIAEVIANGLEADGVAVGIRARHYCMMMHGAALQSLPTVSTTAYLGAFEHNAELRNDFLREFRF